MRELASKWQALRKWVVGAPVGFVEVEEEIGACGGGRTLALLSCISYGLSEVREGLFERLFEVKGGVKLSGVPRDGSTSILDGL